MKLEYRNCTIGELIATFFVCGFAIILCGVGIYAVYMDENPAFSPIMRNITAFVIGSVFCVPCIVLTCISCVSFTEKLVISEDAVIFYRGNKQVRHLTGQKITVFGCAAFMHRNGYIFFCETPLEEIYQFSQQHQQKAIRLFGKKRLMQDTKENERRYQIAVGTYIQLERRNNERVIILKQASPRILKEIGSIFGKKPVLTGPIILDNPKPWN